jgi:O-antigen ligase
MLLLIPTWPGRLWGFQTDKNSILLLIICAFAVSTLLHLNHFRLFFPSRNPIVFMLFTIFITSFFRPDVFQSIRNAIAVLLSFIIILFLTAILHSLPIKTALLLFACNLTFLATVSALVHLLTIGNMTFFEHNTITRVSGLFFFAENAMMTGLSILISIMLFFFDKRKKILILNIVICSIILSSTDTRSVMLALICAISYVLNFNKFRGLLKMMIVVISLILMVSSYIFLHSGDAEVENYNYEKLRVRELIWKVSINGIISKPISGYGNENPFQNSISQKISDILNDAHNSHLMYMLIFGIPVWFLFILYYINTVYYGFKNYRPEFQIFNSIALFWIIISWFWGRIFLTGASVLQIMFMVSLLGIMNHPEAYKNLKYLNRCYRFKISM